MPSSFRRPKGKHLLKPSKVLHVFLAATSASLFLLLGLIVYPKGFNPTSFVEILPATKLTLRPPFWKRLVV
jgi:hypothetical protein